MPEVVGFQKSRPAAPRLGQAQGQTGGQAVVFAVRMGQHAQPGVARGKGSGHGQGLVRGAVLHQQNFDVLHALPQNAAQRAGQVAGVIVAGHDDRDDGSGKHEPPPQKGGQTAFSLSFCPQPRGWVPGRTDRPAGSADGACSASGRKAFPAGRSAPRQPACQRTGP